MASLTRQRQRADAQASEWASEAIEQYDLAQAHLETLEAERQTLKDELYSRDLNIGVLNDVVTNERLRRVRAQVVLADDIQTPCYECGKPWRPPISRKVGYDPRTDPVVLEDIKAGRLPPFGFPIKELLAPKVEYEAKRLKRQKLVADLGADRETTERPKRPPRRVRRARLRMADPDINGSVAGEVMGIASNFPDAEMAG